MSRIQEDVGGFERFVRESVASSNPPYVPHVEGAANQREALQCYRQRMLNVLIFPERAAISVAQPVALHPQVPIGRFLYWVVAETQGEVVFFDEDIGKFGKAVHVTEPEKHLLDLGFRTDDALDAFMI